MHALDGAHVHAVTGPVATRRLGRCYAHAHLLGGPAEHPLDGSVAAADLHLDDAEHARAELLAFRAAGGATIVEMSCLDFGRSLSGLRTLSVATGTTIVATTGFRRGRTAVSAGVPLDWKELADRFERDVLEGEDGVTCGVIKAGSGAGELSDADRVVLRAAAAAQLRTGAPISTHTEAGQLVEEQLSELEAAGADLSRVAVAHVDRAYDVQAHRAALERGAYLIYDQIGKAKYRDAAGYAELLRWVVDEGYADRVMLSSDFGRRSYLASWGGSPGIDYVLVGFVEEMRALGVPEEILELGTLDTPARFFACVRNSCAAEAAVVEGAA